MDFYEQLVHYYLTVVERFPVLPQIKVTRSTAGTPWAAKPDFLALDFAGKRILIVQVKTTDRRNFDQQAAGLAETLKSEHRNNVESCVRDEILAKQLHFFPIHYRFHVREANVQALECKDDYVQYKKEFGTAEVVPLELVFNVLKDRMPR